MEFGEGLEHPSPLQPGMLGHSISQCLSADGTSDAHPCPLSCLGCPWSLSLGNKSQPFRLPEKNHLYPVSGGSPGGASGKEPNAGVIRFASLLPGSRRSPGGGCGNSLQYSCLENPMDRGACQAMVHKVTKSWTRLKWLSAHACILSLEKSCWFPPSDSSPLDLQPLSQAQTATTLLRIKPSLINYHATFIIITNN